MFAYIKDDDTGRYYKVELSKLSFGNQARFRGSKSALSAGFSRHDGLGKDVLETMRGSKNLIEVSRDEFNHSGCLSSCKLRGQSECRW